MNLLKSITKYKNKPGEGLFFSGDLRENEQASSSALRGNEQAFAFENPRLPAGRQGSLTLIITCSPHTENRVFSGPFPRSIPFSE